MISNREDREKAIADVEKLFQYNPFDQSDFRKKENDTKAAYLADAGNCFGIGVEYARRVINGADRPKQKSTIEKLSNSHLKKNSNLAYRIALYQTQVQTHLYKNKEKYQIEIDTKDVDNFFDKLISRLNQSNVQGLTSRVSGKGGHTFLFRKEGDDYIIFDSNFGEFKTRDKDDLKNAFVTMRKYYSFSDVDFSNVDLYDLRQLVEDLGLARKSRDNKDSTYKIPEKITLINARYETVKTLFDNSTPEQIKQLMSDTGKTALLLATIKGEVQLVELLLDNGAQFSWSNMILAAENGRKDVIEVVVNRGYSIEKDDKLDMIRRVVSKGQVEVFKYLFDDKIELNELFYKDAEPDQKFIQSFILMALKAKQYEIVNSLLDSFEIQNKSEYLPILDKVLKLSDDIPVDIFEKIINNLIDKGAEVFMLQFLPDANFNIETPLMHVIRRCGDSTVQKFIDAGASLGDFNKDATDSPLSYAAMYGRTAVIQMFFDGGEDIDLREFQRGYVLYKATAIAVMYGQFESFYKLVSLGATLDSEHIDLYFSTAVDYKNVELLSKLIELGADVNVALYGGRTALNRSVELGHVEMTKKLLEAGADVSTLKEEDIKKASPEIQALISDHKAKFVEQETSGADKKKLGHVDRLVAYHQGRIDEQRVEKPKKRDSHTARVTESKSTEGVKSRQ